MIQRVDGLEGRFTVLKEPVDLGHMIGLRLAAQAGVVVAVAGWKLRPDDPEDSEGVFLPFLFGGRSRRGHPEHQPVDLPVTQITQGLTRGLPLFDDRGGGINDPALGGIERQRDLPVATRRIVDDQAAEFPGAGAENLILDVVADRHPFLALSAIFTRASICSSVSVTI